MKIDSLKNLMKIFSNLKPNPSHFTHVISSPFIIKVVHE